MFSVSIQQLLIAKTNTAPFEVILSIHIFILLQSKLFANLLI
jgi:hypothetical protein